MPIQRRNYTAQERRAIAPNLALIANKLRVKDPLTASAIDEVQRSLSDIVVEMSRFMEFFDRIDVLGADGELAGWVGSDAEQGVVAGAWFRRLFVGGTGPTDAPIVADENGDVEIDGDVIVNGTVSAEKFNVLTPMIDGLTFTNNSPAAGRIAWSASTLTYAGTVYTIASGNTPTTAERYVTWTVGASSFSSSATYTPSASVFLIATNTGGTADTAFNKVATSGITRDNLSFSLLTGLQIRPISTTSVLFTTAGDTTILSESQAGGLLSLRIEATSAMAAAATVVVKISVDGQSPVSIPIYTASTTFDPDLQAYTPHGSGTGAVSGDFAFIQLQLGYSSSCTVTGTVSGTAAGQSMRVQVLFARATS